MLARGFVYRLLLDAVFSKPIFRTTDIIQQLHIDFGIHEKTISGLLRSLREGGVLKELRAASGNRPAVLCFPELLNIAEGRKVV